MHCKLISAAAAGLLGLAAAAPLDGPIPLVSHVVKTTTTTTTYNPNEVATGTVAVPTVTDTVGGASKDAYVYYTGNGSAAAKWPAHSKWASFDNLFTANTAAMKQSCGNNNEGANDSADEIANIRKAIEAVAGTSKVDNRFILAVIMQESEGW